MVKLYHYSSVANGMYRRLQTKRITFSLKEPQKGDTYGLNYNDHISLFFERVPLDIIANVFGGENDFWKSGHKLYEYEIDINDIELGSFVVVEMPELMKFYYDDNINDEDYIKIKHDMQFMRYTKDELVAFCKRYQNGATREKYKELGIRINSVRESSEIKKKYAPAVPHVLVFPKFGIIKYRHITEVIVK